MGDKLEEIKVAMTKGQVPQVQEMVRACLNEGLSPHQIMNDALVAAMSVIGRRFRDNEMFMPEVMIAARAMNAGLEVLDPLLSQTDGNYKGKILLETVRGDLHDVGKNMVSMMFRGAGFKVIDIGVDVPEDKLVEAVREHQPDIVALSALLTTTTPNLKTAIDALVAAELRDRVVMVGGAPVTLEFAQAIGADGWAPDSASAVERAIELMAQRK